MAMSDGDGFLSRWSRRKVQARQGEQLPQVATDPCAMQPDALPERIAPTRDGQAAAMPTDATAAASSAATAVGETAATPAAPPPPTLADVAQLTRESDFARFVAPDVGAEVKNAALKKLFSDPHFNVMDGLDVYIDDYGKPDPLPASMLRQMAQAAYLGLLEDEPRREPTTPATAEQPPPTQPAHADDRTAASHREPPEAPAPDEDADLRLQSHDAARCGSVEPRAADAGNTAEP